MLRRALLLAVASGALMAFAPSAHADGAGWGDDVDVMDDAEMGDLRGGIRIGGVDVGFGAVVTTYANGVRALETRLVWTDAGALVTEAIGSLGQRIEAMTPEQRAALGLEGLTGGVVIDDADGVTALAHNISKGSLQNIIVNSASGRDLTQTVDVTITLPSFEMVQQAFDVERFGLRVDADFRHALTNVR